MASLLQFWRDLSSQKLRTTLTVLGITWGTVAVVALLAFGVGFEKQTRKNMHGMGDGIVVMFGGTTTKAYQGFGDGRPVRLREDDVRMMQQQIREIRQISPEYTTSRAPVRVDTSVTTPTITGIYPIYGDMRNILPEPGGRFINEIDQRDRRRVVVLGDQLKGLLFAEREAVGEQVLISGVPFTVVGVMQKKTQNSSYNSRDADRLFMAASTYRSLFGDKYLSNIIYKPADPALSAAVEKQVYEVMGRRYKFDPTDEDALGIWDTSQMNEMLNGLFLGIKLFLGIVGSFTLTVGGIGVANIMYVVVKERTREIGVKRSLGARKRDILVQFFLESSAIVAVGALCGFLIALGLVKAVGMLPIQEQVGQPAISPQVAAATIGLLALIAFMAGFFPARKAANLDPVESLRYGV